MVYHHLLIRHVLSKSRAKSDEPQKAPVYKHFQAARGLTTDSRSPKIQDSVTMNWGRLSGIHGQPVQRSSPRADWDSALKPPPEWSGHAWRRLLWHKPWPDGTSRSHCPSVLDWHLPARDTGRLRHRRPYGTRSTPECPNTQAFRERVGRPSQHTLALHPACCRIPLKGKPNCSRLRRYRD